jgi:uncharacterized damage-inducible protein DinB
MIEPTPNTEREALLRYLDAQREHALGILEGLDEEALRRPVLPSGWSCLGLVRHLALDVERFWFGAVVAGDRAIIDEFAAGPDNAWEIAADQSASAIFELYRRESARTNSIIAATPLDAAPAWWPGDLFGDFRLHTIREVVLHTLTETACHTGHLDAARELIDGRRWLVLTE